MLVLSSLSLLITDARQTVLTARLNADVILIEVLQRERLLFDKVFQNQSIQKLLSCLGRLLFLFE